MIHKRFFIPLILFSCLFLFSFLSFSSTPPVITIPEPSPPYFLTRWKVHPYRETYAGPFGHLSNSDIAIAVLVSNNTLSRIESGPFPLWTSTKGDMKVTIFTPQPYPSLSNAISLDIPEPPNNQIIEFSLLALRKNYELFPDKKWYMKLDDDAYLYTSNFMETLKELDSNDLIYGGKQLLHEEFFSGGAGYFLSNGVMKRIAENAENCLNEFFGNKTREGPEDVLVHICATKKVLGMKNVNVPGMYPYEPDTIPRNPWHGSPEGFVEYPITFHWIKDLLFAKALHEGRIFMQN